MPQHEPPHPQVFPPHFVEMHVHALFLQKSPMTVQSLPQVPQLKLSSVRLTQAPEQLA